MYILLNFSIVLPYHFFFNFFLFTHVFPVYSPPLSLFVRFPSFSSPTFCFRSFYSNSSNFILILSFLAFSIPFSLTFLFSNWELLFVAFITLHWNPLVVHKKPFRSSLLRPTSPSPLSSIHAFNRILNMVVPFLQLHFYDKTNKEIVSYILLYKSRLNFKAKYWYRPLLRLKRDWNRWVGEGQEYIFISNTKNIHHLNNDEDDMVIIHAK